MANFIVVGDIGCPGEGRTRVARGVRTLVDTLREKGDPPLFVLTTGDNLYDDVDETADAQTVFTALKNEMLDTIGLPWFFTLGNHDVSKEGMQWHMTDWNHLYEKRTWKYILPASCYSLNDGLKHCANEGKITPLEGLCEIVVINTNKYNLTAKAPGIGEDGSSTRWWHYQKKWFSRRLSSSSAPWKIVVGHHPIEYIPLNNLEHVVPGVRYVPTTFMKGGPKSRFKGTSYRDVIGDVSDLYICGHQHLMAHLVRDVEEKEKKKKKKSCEYAIIGSSSKTEEGPCSDDERESDSETSSEGSSGPSLKQRIASKFAPKVDEEKYSESWHSQELGFCHIVVSHTSLELRYYTLSEDDLPLLSHSRCVQKDFVL